MLTTQQIGKCGELLLQYRLLMVGIESAPLTTDTGIDLVAYIPSKRKPVSIQVKANLQPKPGGGKGRLALDWWIPEDSPADVIALVDLSREMVWLLTMDQLSTVAQQHSGGRFHIYMYVETDAKPTGVLLTKGESQFAQYLIAKILPNL